MTVRSWMSCLNSLACFLSVLLFCRNGFDDMPSPHDPEMVRPGRKQGSQKRVSSILFVFNCLLPGVYIFVCMFDFLGYMNSGGCPPREPCEP